MNTDYSQFYFGDSFQNLVLANMVRNPEAFQVLGDLVLPEYFNGLHAMQACSAMRNFIKKWKNYPTFEELGQHIYTEFPREEKQKADELLGYINMLEGIEVRNLQYVIDNVVKFSRERALINAVRITSAHIKEGTWPKEGFAPMFSEALQVGENLENLGYNVPQTSDEVVDKVTAVSYGIKTGYQNLDAIWHNGWGPGWLITILAPPKSFKTCFATCLALNIAAKKDRPEDIQPVFYYACEISAELAAMRAYSNLTGWSMAQIYAAPKKFKRVVKETLLRTIGAPLIVKFFPSKTATIDDIRKHAKAVAHQYKNPFTQQPLRPKAIIIDHAETIKPKLTGKNISDWRQQADIYSDARALGAELGCPVIMPDRCNRETAERATPSLTSFQGSFEKAGIVDVAIGICQTPEERAENLCTNMVKGPDGILQPETTINPVRYFVFVNRHGRQYVHFDGTVNPELMTMEVGKEIKWEPDDDDKAGRQLDKQRARASKGDNTRRRKLKLIVDPEDV